MDISVVLGAFAGMLLGFYGIAKVMLLQASKDRDADRNERKEFIAAVKDMAGASGRVADATVKSAIEAEQRNGHLGELISQGNETTNQILSTLDKSANIRSKESHGSGQLVKTKEDK